MFMSLFVLAVAAGHAIPPIIGGAVLKSKKAVIIGSIMASIIAIVSGNPVFIMADLIGVAIGTWLGLSMLETTSKG
jgi:Na+/citrate or Na+/malate symporter